MKSTFGGQVKVSNDSESCGDFGADVTLAVEDAEVLLSPVKARKLARKLREQAAVVEKLNRGRS